MREKGKKLSKKIIFAIVCAVVACVIIFTCGGMQIAFVLADKIKCWHPDYEMIDISPILDKDIDKLSDEDYDTLYSQTGLTRIGIERALKRGKSGKTQVLNIQKDFFTEHKVKNDLFAPFICTDYLDDYMTHIYIEDGDIVVTTSTHLSGWRMGHAGLVTDAAMNRVLQASAVGSLSDIGKMQDFTDRVNFMVLSPKADADVKAEIVQYAKDNLTGIPYDPTVGVFTNKKKIKKTQCAHIVWYAYKQFGIDLDSDGGLVVTPKDIANSPFVELVQVFGLNPNQLWK